MADRLTHSAYSPGGNTTLTAPCGQKESYIMRKVLTQQVRIYHVINGQRVDGQPTDITGNLSGITGDLTDITGNLSGITGDLTDITGNLSGITGNLSGIRGDLSGITGNLNGITGDLNDITGDLNDITGNLNDITGNLDLAEITPEERKAGINVEDLII